MLDSLRGTARALSSSVVSAHEIAGIVQTASTANGEAGTTTLKTMRPAGPSGASWSTVPRPTDALLPVSDSASDQTVANHTAIKVVGQRRYRG